MQLSGRRNIKERLGAIEELSGELSNVEKRVLDESEGYAKRAGTKPKA